jgi:hypothetical protein
MLEADTLETALPSVRFLNDIRIQHYYDPHRKTGRTIADSVGWTGNVAWDIYLFYRPYVDWTDKPPLPSRWMHQLTDSWATKKNYRTGADLKYELLVSIDKLVRLNSVKNLL